MQGGFDPQGPVAGEISGLWWLLFWLGLAVFVLFSAFLAVALVRHRRIGGSPATTGADEEAMSSRYTRWWIVGLGVCVTSAVLVVVLAFTIASIRAIPYAAGRGALVIELVGHQWYWQVTYPAHDIGDRNVLHVPVGEQVELRITSADVIHSFWVPQLAGKMDAIPARTNLLVLQADKPGEYRGRCAEFCGLFHADMQVTVVAMDPVDFAAWLESRR